MDGHHLFADLSGCPPATATMIDLGALKATCLNAVQAVCNPGSDNSDRARRLRESLCAAFLPAHIDQQARRRGVGPDAQQWA